MLLQLWLLSVMVDKTVAFDDQHPANTFSFQFYGSNKSELDFPMTVQIIFILAL